MNSIQSISPSDQRDPAVGLNKIEQVLIQGNLQSLSTDEKLFYYKKVCDSIGLNHLTKPFEYIQLNGKLVLYATRACTDQLRKIHRISVRIKERQTLEGVYIVIAEATDSSGRVDESIGVVPIIGLKGDSLGNALMKAETKAKRRATLSICGLGILDESEIEGAVNAPFQNAKNSINKVVHCQTEDTEERRKLIQHLEHIAKSKSIDDLAVEFKDKLTPQQRLLVGAEEISRIKNIALSKTETEEVPND